MDGDGDGGFYPIAWEEIPDQNGDLVARYELVSVGKIKVETTIVQGVSPKK